MKEIMTVINQANIRAIGYYSWQKIVFIEFNSGCKYQYFDVPADIYKEFSESVSKGSYLNRNFKGEYRYCVVDEFEKNLCYICKNCIADCKAKNVKFGDGMGKDNVIECDSLNLQLTGERR